jgi:hypothetical protein
MARAILITKLKVVEFRSALSRFRQTRDEIGLEEFQSHTFGAGRLGFLMQPQSRAGEGNVIGRTV